MEVSMINKINKIIVKNNEDRSKELILELKYDMEYDSKVNSITNALKTRLHKNSKYVEAFEFLKK